MQLDGIYNYSQWGATSIAKIFNPSSGYFFTIQGQPLFPHASCHMPAHLQHHRDSLVRWCHRQDSMQTTINSQSDQHDWVMKTTRYVITDGKSRSHGIKINTRSHDLDWILMLSNDVNSFCFCLFFWCHVTNLVWIYVTWTVLIMAYGIVLISFLKSRVGHTTSSKSKLGHVSYFWFWW